MSSLGLRRWCARSCRWLGQTSPSRPLQGLRFITAVPRRRRRLRDDPRRVDVPLGAQPASVAARLVRRPLHVVFTTARSSAHRPSERSEDRPVAPTGFISLSGFGPRCPLRSSRGPDRPSWGSCPSSDFGGEIRMTRAFHARHHPSSGFLTPSTVCSPSRLADTLGPLPLMGSPLEGSFERRADARCRTSCALFVRGALQPRTLRNTRSKAPRPRRHLSSCVLVPRPWSQNSRVPFGAHHLQAVAEAFAPASPLARLSPPHLGEPRCF